MTKPWPCASSTRPIRGAPRIVGGLLISSAGGHIGDVAFGQDRVFVTLQDCGSGGCSSELRVLDASALPRLEELARLRLGPTDQTWTSLSLEGERLYVGAGEAGVWVVDVAQPDRPRLLAHFDTPGRAEAVWPAGGQPYVADGAGGVLVLREFP